MLIYLSHPRSLNFLEGWRKLLLVFNSLQPAPNLSSGDGFNISAMRVKELRDFVANLPCQSYDILLSPSGGGGVEDEVGGGWEKVGP